MKSVIQKYVCDMWCIVVGQWMRAFVNIYVCMKKKREKKRRIIPKA